MGKKVIEVPTEVIVHNNSTPAAAPANGYYNSYYRQSRDQDEEQHQQFLHYYQQYQNQLNNGDVNVLSNGYASPIAAATAAAVITTNANTGESEPQLLNSSNNNQATSNTDTTKPKKKWSAKKRRRMRICILVSILVTAILVGVGVGAVSLLRNPRFLKYPLHASCNITWTFSVNCNNIRQALLDQIETWKTNTTCGTGQKCLYALEYSEGDILKATHTTPVRRYIDDMQFTFYSNTKKSGRGCNVVGFSTSRTWYAVLDYGTNYCNLHNLVDGAGLTKDKSYSEQTSDGVCTQYSSSNCDKY